MSPSPSTSTPWVPVWPQAAKPAVPTPLVNGKWMSSVGGAMTWVDLPPTDGLVTPDTGWHIVGAAGEPQLGNAWSNYGGLYGPARFRKLADGMVVLDGLIYGGNDGQVAFWMPAGYVPPAAPGGGDTSQHFYTASSAGANAVGNAWGTVYLLVTGGQAAVVPMIGNSNNWTSLAGITYHAES